MRTEQYKKLLVVWTFAAIMAILTACGQENAENVRSVPQAKPSATANAPVELLPSAEVSLSPEVTVDEVVEAAAEEVTESEVLVVEVVAQPEVKVETPKHCIDNKGKDNAKSKSCK